MIENLLSFISDKTKNYIIFDIGARDCLQSIEFYKHFPNAKIYAFECNPNTVQLCKENIKNYSDRITLIEGAVSNSDGEITFYPINQTKTITTWKDGNPGASSLFRSNGTYPIEHYVQDEIKTNCHRLDTMMKKYNIPRVDVIWMDLQGAELLALQGLGDYIKTVKYIHTEVSFKEMYSGQVMFEELNQYIISHNFNLKNKLNTSGWQDDAIYCSNLFDIVIPVGPLDVNIIKQQLQWTCKNVIGYRNIFLVSTDPLLEIEGCITVLEKNFPFSIETVQKCHGKSDRNGWYLQQLLKLYAGIVIPDILEKYLVIDSDTFFLKPTRFLKNGRCLYNYGIEYHKPYFEHMSKLHETFRKQYPDKSGICHHMIFETKYVKEIMTMVEAKHFDTFYNVFLKNVTEVLGAGASEYELYFNYMVQYHPEEIYLRKLNWANVNKLDLFSEIFDYISYHWYMRST